MKRVLLYSGGLDSFIYNHILKPDICLYIDNNSKYSQIEIRNIKKYHSLKNLKIVKTIDMKNYEEKDGGIQNRNLIFILQALFYGKEVYLGVNKEDVRLDSNVDFLNDITSLLNKSMNEIVKIHSPLYQYNKSDLVKHYINSNGDIERLKKIYSCYRGEEKQCGVCKPCIRNKKAFLDNNINIKNMYEV